MKNWKANAIFFLFLSVGAMVVWQLYSLQIKKGEYYEALALGQRVSFYETNGKRGEIFLVLETAPAMGTAPENLPLAQTKRKNIIRIFPEKIPEAYLEKEAEILANTLSLKKDELISTFQKGESFKKEISEQELQEIKQAIRQEEIKGASLDEISGRFYPQKDLASHVIGFVNEEGKGQYGVEGYYDEILRGQEGFRETGKTPLDYLFLDSKNEEFSLEGTDVWLTIDYNIQYFSEKLLKEAKEQWDIDSGQIIVQEPSTGRVLALANFPSFNLNQYSSQEGLEIFLNGATQKLFEPGSVFKPITMASALEEGLITPETEYEDKGYVKVGGPPIYNFQRRVWGVQSMTDVLEESINTGAVFVGEKLGKDLFWKYLEKFGFFEKTEIDLQREFFSPNETLKSGYPRDFAVASFGQGIEITPIQLVRAFGSIANGGKLMKPYIVERLIKSSGEETTIQPQIQRRVISERTAAKLTAMLVNVVEQGSGRRTKIEGYFIAGKTGTAQVVLERGEYSEEKTIQSFLGYFPALAPEVLIFVKLDNPKEVTTAEYCAVPLFRKLAKHIIDLWEIPPSY